MTDKKHKWATGLALAAVIMLTVFADKYPQYSTHMIFAAGLVVGAATVTHFKRQFRLLKETKTSGDSA